MMSRTRWYLIVAVWCAGWQIQTLAVADDSPHRSVPTPADQVQQWPCGESDWEPDSGVALAAAQERLVEALGRWLAVERPSLRGSLLTKEQLNRLVCRPEVLRRQERQSRERGYGTMWQVRLEVEIGQETVEEWASEIRSEHRRE